MLRPILPLVIASLLLGALINNSSAGNFPGDLPPIPDFGPFAEGSPHDSEGWVVELLADPDPAGMEKLRRQAHADPSPEMMATVARATVLIGEKLLALGDSGAAARAGINIYLSSSPHNWRVRALELFVRTGDLGEIDRQLQMIRTQRQDSWMSRYLPQWDKIVAERMATQGC